MKPGLKKHFIFVLTVLLPTVAAVLYYGLVASDVFISESRFVVRSPQRQAQTGLRGRAAAGHGLRALAGRHLLGARLHPSRDALRELDEEARRAQALRTAANSRLLQPLSGPRLGRQLRGVLPLLPGKVHGRSRHRSRRSSTLRVRAFTAADAQRINEHAARDGRAPGERAERAQPPGPGPLRGSRGDAGRGQGAGRRRWRSPAFRSEQAVFEPDRQAAIQLQGVAKLQDELIATETQLAQLRALSPGNPQIPALADSGRDAAPARWPTETAKVTGGGGSLSAHARRRSSASRSRRSFADRQLAAALTALETARSEAQRKQLYLERIVQPNLPDEALEPRRIRSILTVLVLGADRLGHRQPAGGGRPRARRLSRMASSRAPPARRSAIQRRVIGALLMREVITRFGRAQPRLAVAVRRADDLHARRHGAVDRRRHATTARACRSSPSRSPATRRCCCGATCRRAASTAIEANKGLLYHRNVQRDRRLR